MRRKIAIATDRRGDAIQHFGQCLAFKIYESSGGSVKFLDRENLSFCGSVNGGYVEDTARLVGDCDLLVVAAIGACGRQAMSSYKTMLVEIDGSIESALDRISGLVSK